MRRRLLAAALATVAALAGPVAAEAPVALAADGVHTVCRFSDQRFTEISGLTYSQRHPGVLYLHNDSGGGPRIYAVDGTTCRTLATFTIAGVPARDMEAIASGRDRKGRPVLWVGDIGDNLDSWPYVSLYRVREPKRLRDRTLTPAVFRFTYPDRPHNAEALLADPRGTAVWVVTKQLAAGRLYALPDPMSTTSVNRAKPLRKEGAMVTDGSVSPDGSRYVLRDYVDATVFRGLPPGTDPQTVYLPLQLQGEAVTWTPDGSALLVASERDNRLLRVELSGGNLAPAAATATTTAAPSADPSRVPPSAASTRTPVSTAPPAADSAEPSDQPGGGQLLTALVAGGLVLAAVAVVVVAETRRRRRGRHQV